MKPFEGDDERNYQAAQQALEDRVGYPFPERDPQLKDDGFRPLTGQDQARQLLDKLEPGEPVFVLRGKDISAAIFVRAWIELQSLNPQVRPRKMRMARQIHLAMQQYQQKDWPT